MIVKLLVCVFALAVTSLATKFEGAEHRWLGDATWNRFASEDDKGKRFSLPNGAKVTFGEVVGLAGDFWGNVQHPLSDAKTLEDGITLFKQVFDDYTSKDGDETFKIIIQFQKEYAGLTSQNGVGTGTHLSNLPSFNAKYATITNGRFLALAAHNFDHFGDSDHRSGGDAPFSPTSSVQRAYVIAHTTAFQTALEYKDKKTDELLEKAYLQEAWALHFLTDMFAAGHMRTPRRLFFCDEVGSRTLYQKATSALTLGSRYLGDNNQEGGIMLGGLIAKCMHDEDNRRGLKVKNKNGDTWTAYGDGELFDEQANENRRRAVHAAQTSFKEIRAAAGIEDAPPSLLQKQAHLFKKKQERSKQRSNPEYAALKETPLPTSQNMSPMFIHTEAEGLQFRVRLAEGEAPLYKSVESIGCGKVYQDCSTMIDNWSLVSPDYEIGSHPPTKSSLE
jgi:hypothetical protein